VIWTTWVVCRDLASVGGGNCMADDDDNGTSEAKAASDVFSHTGLHFTKK